MTKLKISERFDLVLEDGGRSQRIYDKRDMVARDPVYFRMACSRVELSFVQGALRRIIEQQADERGERPIQSFPEHMGALSACIKMNVDIPERMRRYAEAL